jgi:hypothetical protein
VRFDSCAFQLLSQRSLRAEHHHALESLAVQRRHQMQQRDLPAAERGGVIEKKNSPGWFHWQVARLCLAL